MPLPARLAVGRFEWPTFPSKSRISKRMQDLVAVAHEGLSLKAEEPVLSERRQPRSRDKPVIRD